MQPTIGARCGIDVIYVHDMNFGYFNFSRDSDSDSSYNRWYSWTGRRSFLTNRLSYDRSLDSDTSGLSSVTRFEENCISFYYRTLVNH